MNSELTPDRNLRMSDSDRERVAARLQTAAGEGRLSLAEFEERMGGVLAARTFGDIEPYVADLPVDGLSASASQPLDLYVRGSRVSREGRWAVPARIRIDALGATVKLDFTEAALSAYLVAIEVDLHGTGLRLILPEGATLDATDVSLNGSAVKQRGIAAQPEPGRLHLAVRGYLRGSTIRARRPRTSRFKR